MFKGLTAAILIAAASSGWAAVPPADAFVGSFAEPVDGGNLDTQRSTFDGRTVVIVPRAHPSEAIDGAARWRNVLFAVRGVRGKSPEFVLPLTSPGTGESILSGNSVSFHHLKLVWSYDAEATAWHEFDRTTRVGDNPSTWTVKSQNTAPFTDDIVYVSINEHAPVAEY